jgi:hypothetical protein
VYGIVLAAAAVCTYHTRLPTEDIVELNDVIAATLRLGCGIELEELTESERFQADVRKRALLEPSVSDPYLTTLIEHVGDALLTAAFDCLPKGVTKRIERFATLDAEGQIRLIGKVFKAFRKATDLSREPDGESDETDLSYVLPEWWLRRINLKYPAQRVLPHQYGELGRNGQARPTCLGICLMLAAFARATGLPFLVANPIGDADIIICETRGRFSQAILDHMDHVGIERNDFRANMLQDVVTAETLKTSVEDFHYSVVIRVSDGRWVLLDPYRKKRGVLSPDWDVESVYRQLSANATTQPGTVLSSSDGGTTQRWCDEWEARFHTVIRLIESLLQSLLEAPANILLATSEETDRDYYDWKGAYFPDPFSIACYLSGTAATDELLATLLTYQGSPKEVLVADLTGVSRVVHYEAMGLHDEIIRLTAKEGSAEYAEQTARLELVFESVDIQFQDDPETRRQYFEKLALTLIGEILACWNQALEKKQPRLLDPSMQFGLPEFNLGLAVISHVRAWSFPSVPGRILLGLSSGQITWHEAVDLSQGLAASDADHPEVLAAEVAVRELPHIHAACANKLHYIDRMRSEREHDGKASEGSHTRGTGRPAR